ncbi:phosphatase 2C-like domain-containing protein [Aspergillus pseudoustus]|uniref:Phosphatase 2C-like domain-containing protein n=1 Tax=Aspergillus pseudoustus TaxID=1810923 RepID=A0ABR4IK28_9EURO
MDGTTKDSVALNALGSASVQGSRQSQQDRFIVLTPDKLPSSFGRDVALFAVFDGHGSEIVAEHAVKHVPKFLLNSPVFREGDYERAMQSAIDQEDKALFKEFRAGEMHFATAGSTATIAVVDLAQRVLVVGNLGDSHAFLAERGAESAELTSVTRLTESHKPDSPDEKRRIEDAGGTVLAQKNIARIGALNMSRALGDLEYKQPLNNMDSGPITEEQKFATDGQDRPPEERGSFLSIDMSFKRTELSKEKQYLLCLTTDGVTNYMEDKVIMHSLSHLFKSGLRADEVARSLVDDAASRPGSDNATCIVALLDGAQVKGQKVTLPVESTCVRV